MNWMCLIYSTFIQYQRRLSECCFSPSYRILWVISSFRLKGRISDSKVGRSLDAEEQRWCISDTWPGDVSTDQTSRPAKRSECDSRRVVNRDDQRMCWSLIIQRKITNVLLVFGLKIVWFYGTSNEIEKLYTHSGEWSQCDDISGNGRVSDPKPSSQWSTSTFAISTHAFVVFVIDSFFISRCYMTHKNWFHRKPVWVRYPTLDYRIGWRAIDSTMKGVNIWFYLGVMVSCKCSLQPIHWLSSWCNRCCPRPQTAAMDQKLNVRLDKAGHGPWRLQSDFLW